MPALPTISRPGSKITFSPRLRMASDDVGIGVGQRRRIVVGSVGNAQPATEIDMLDGVAVGAQCVDQFGQQLEGVVERLQIGDLAADMHVDADRP